MRVAFFGTPAFAVPTLRALLGSAHQVVFAVTQPDRPRGRGQKVTPGPVKALAVEHNIPVLQPEKLTREPWEQALHMMSMPDQLSTPRPRSAKESPKASRSASVTRP